MSWQYVMAVQRGFICHAVCHSVLCHGDMSCMYQICHWVRHAVVSCRYVMVICHYILVYVMKGCHGDIYYEDMSCAYVMHICHGDMSLYFHICHEGMSWSHMSWRAPSCQSVMQVCHACRYVMVICHCVFLLYVM